jgi:2-polyprenyl-3-methyl-5-hydroxy-6-metoxy-1,4-benzoquinol methylase/predicted nucleotidyltransferase
VSATDTRAQAIAAAASAGRLLYDAGAQRVWLCGSLAHGNHWDALSDVDYATIGLPSSQHPAVVHRLRERLGRHVDVIPLEDAPSFIRTQITLEMMVVERDGSVVRHRGRTPALPVATLQCPAYPKGLHAQRHAAVADMLERRGVRAALDVGCAEGGFELAARTRWPRSRTRITGIDPDAGAVGAGTATLERDLAPHLRGRARLHVAGIADLPAVWHDHDAVVAIEVIEHLDAATLGLFARHVFRELAPPTVVLTTPNAEYNILFADGDPPGRGSLRHADHRFEWTRDEMRRWVAGHATPAGYRAALRGIGEAHPEFGAPTQMWTLTRDR